MPAYKVLSRALEFGRVAGVHRLASRLQPYGSRPWFPIVAGVLSFGATASLAVPVVPILVSVVALSRHRWRAIAFWAMVGSTLAGTLFTCIAAHYGSAFIDARLPQLAQNKHWHYVVDWTARYGAFVLAAVAASPFAQTPVLLLAAMFGMGWPEVALALAVGKSVKYGVVGSVAAKATDEVVALSSHDAHAVLVARPPGASGHASHSFPSGVDPSQPVDTRSRQP